MEPNILASLRDYVKAQGHPKHAVEFLTENYVGYAQMANLACSWLKLLDSNTGNEVADTTPKQSTPKVAGSAPPSHSVAQPSGAGGAGAGGDAPGAGQQLKAAGSGINKPEDEVVDKQGEAGTATGTSGTVVPFSAMDEAFFLRQLVLDKFDPQKFSGIFSAGGSGAPKWLSGLISDRDGRGIIYTLSAKYQNSLLLNFAMQKILMQPGRDVEAAAVGASLVGYFGVYHRLLAVRLKQAAAARDEATLHQLSKELCESAVESQHAYVHAQQLLREMAVDLSQPWAPRFLRLAQEMEAAVPGPAPWKMHRWYEPEAALQIDNNSNQGDGGGSGGGSGGDGDGKEEDEASTAAWLVSDILASTSSGAPATTSDIIRLYRLYCPRTEEKKEGIEHRRPKVALLRQPRLIEVLLQAVFSPGKQLQNEAQAAFVGVLSLAVAALDDDNTDRDKDTTAAKKGNKNKPSAAPETTYISPLDQPAAISARKALEIAAELAHKALRDEILTPEEREQGEIAMQEPCCAAGLLSMLRSRLTSHEYWAAAYHIHKEPPFLPLFLAIVRQQPSMHSTVLSLISSALGVMGSAPSGPDVANALLQVAVALAAAGRVEEVLEWGERWARNADASLVRIFFFGILEIASPPYSTHFAASMVRLGATGGALKQKMGSKAWMARGPLLAEFAAAGAESLKNNKTTSASGESVLGREETLYLRELNLSLKNSGFSVK
jgi:negative elongation factor C/D